MFKMFYAATGTGTKIKTPLIVDNTTKNALNQANPTCFAKTGLQKNETYPYTIDITYYLLIDLFLKKEQEQ